MKIVNISRNGLIQVIFISLLGFSLAFTMQNGGSNDEWEVPEKYVNMENPMEPDGESLYIGKTVYSKQCKSCHGKYGEGDGNKVDELDTPVGDFTDGSLDEQTDGELYYKTWEGRDDMPAFKKKIEYEEDVWHVINYIRDMID